MKYDGKVNDYMSRCSLYMFHEFKYQRNCNISLPKQNWRQQKLKKIHSI